MASQLKENAMHHKSHLRHGAHAARVHARSLFVEPPQGLDDQSSELCKRNCSGLMLRLNLSLPNGGMVAPPSVVLAAAVAGFVQVAEDA